ncbi:DegT/DnrJ/EryC1/StrS family aminotransferase [Candidatus Bipolaricaulota bacterium]
MNVPVLDLVRQYKSISEEMDVAILEVVRSAKYVLGPYVKEFEEAAAEYCGCKHAIGVASGTDALLLSLKALDIGPGDAVILPSFTFFATAGVVHNVGATPVFCDIDPQTFNLDPAQLHKVLTMDHGPRTRFKAIIPVHLYGQIADMDEIVAIAKEFDLAVIEDAAQAIGAKYWGSSKHVASSSSPVEQTEADWTGEVPLQAAPHKPQALKAGTLGDLGCFSFYPTKNLGAYGDGGMITTNDDELADKIRMLRVHGARPKYYHRMVGINSRLDAIQAAILGVKLRYLDGWSSARGEVADRYDDGLSGIEGLATPFRAEARSHIFHQYTIRVADGRRDELKDHLKEWGIGSMIYYPVPLHLQECFSHLGYAEGQMPESERASRDVLSLPIFPELAIAEQAHVVKAIKAFMER